MHLRAPRLRDRTCCRSFPALPVSFPASNLEIVPLGSQTGLFLCLTSGDFRDRDRMLSGLPRCNSPKSSRRPLVSPPGPRNPASSTSSAAAPHAFLTCGFAAPLPRSTVCDEGHARIHGSFANRDVSEEQARAPGVCMTDANPCGSAVCASAARARSRRSACLSVAARAMRSHGSDKYSDPVSAFLLAISFA